MTGSIDRRLLRSARATRRFLFVSVATGALSGALVVSQAWLIATIVSGAFIDHRSVASLRPQLVALLCVVIGRAALAWSAELASHRASAAAKSELRRAAARHIAALEPAGLERHDAGSLSVLVTTGLDALDGYFARYLPQLLLAVIVPVVVIAVMAGADWVSAAIVAVTVPLIPLFMALVGAATRDRTAARMRSLQRLAGHFLDVVAGLPTLKAFGRAKAQAQAIREMTDRYRTATMATLRLTFLSSLVLELVATISVALVAVAVGLRLLGGHMSFHAALFALVLAPEAYLPLRLLGANFHASADGMAAADQLFALLDEPAATRGEGGTTPEGSPRIEITALSVTYAGRRAPALEGFDLVVEPGEIVALVGPSGCGKSTVLSVLLGLRRAVAGSVRVAGCDLGDIDIEKWRTRVGWVPQQPHLFARSVADNVRLGAEVSDEEVSAALAAAGLGEVVAELPRGMATELGAGGFGLSAGERRRLALARALVRKPTLFLLDEPTAGLDVATEAEVIATLRRLIAGRTAIVVAHRPPLAAIADRVVALTAPIESAS
jgi:ATP-binding cassette subfamily C protein CydCD